MIDIKDVSKCNGCHACMAVCPKQCIQMRADKEGFLYPYVEVKNCIHCGLCKKVCPTQNIRVVETTMRAKAYAAINKDEKVRLQSSSGGLFTAIATYILEQGGVVFGAAFDSAFKVVHIYTESVEGLKEFQGSKYVQSVIGDTYRQAEVFLKEGRKVLFSGTPCQIGGLKAFLQKEYENLYTQDLICHGVPSPLVWEKYVAYRQSLESGAKLREIAFRAKNESWKRYSVSCVFDNDAEYRQTADRDAYMQVFLKNLCLRPSCYDCAFKTKERVADITLADFWGIQHVLPEMDDDKGTSLVIAHSAKGSSLLQAIRETIDCKEVSLDEAIYHNKAMVVSVENPKRRDKFMKEIVKKEFMVAHKKYCRLTVFQKFRTLLGKIKRKIFG